MREALRDDEGRPVQAFRSDRLVGGRRVELRFALVEGRLVCVGLELGPPVLKNAKGPHVFEVVDDGQLEPLRTAEIRLPLRELVDEALERAVALTEGLRPETQARFDQHRAAAKKGARKPGRPPTHGDDHYRKVARIYEETLRNGRRDPLQAIMRALHIEKTAAASKAREARRRGFLTARYFKDAANGK